MHKELMILGLVADYGPITGYDLHRIVRAHGELFTDLKKPNMYYLLERLGKERFLKVRTTPGARGARGERLYYTLTATGRARFHALLAEEISRYDPVHTGIEVAVIFLSRVPRKTAVQYLEARRTAMLERRRSVTAALTDVSTRGHLAQLSADHIVSSIDTELAWVSRALSAMRKANIPRQKHS